MEELRAFHAENLHSRPSASSSLRGLRSVGGGHIGLRVPVHRRGEGKIAWPGQVLFPDGEWRDVRPGPGQFVINLGDMMERWTNGRWRSTVHRVVNPPRAQTAGSRRQTVGFFLHPNYGARIECLPTCTDAGHPRHHAPVLAGEHMLAKLERRETRPSAAV